MLFETLPGGIWNKITDERWPNVAGLKGVEALKVASTCARAFEAPINTSLTLSLSQIGAR